MKLFHGSNIYIDTPDLIKSKPYKDFGQGFYLSNNMQQALDLAKQKVEQLFEGSPCVTCFEWDKEAALKALKIKVFEDYCEEWANFVLANRDRSAKHPTHNYDIVIGPIADDGVTFQLKRYKLGVINMKVLIDELKYAKGLTLQYFFGTARALTFLKKL